MGKSRYSDQRLLNEHQIPIDVIEAPYKRVQIHQYFQPCQTVGIDAQHHDREIKLRMEIIKSIFGHEKIFQILRENCYDNEAHNDRQQHQKLTKPNEQLVVIAWTQQSKLYEIKNKNHLHIKYIRIRKLNIRILPLDRCYRSYWWSHSNGVATPFEKLIYRW